MSGLRTAIYRKILYNSGFLGGKNGLLRCNFEQLLVVIRAFGTWLMHFYDLHLGVLRFFSGAKAEIAGFIATDYLADCRVTMFWRGFMLFLSLNLM